MLTVKDVNDYLEKALPLGGYLQEEHQENFLKILEKHGYPLRVSLDSDSRDLILEVADTAYWLASGKDDIIHFWRKHHKMKYENFQLIVGLTRILDLNKILKEN